jgi:hypothetical protein
MERLEPSGADPREDWHTLLDLPVDDVRRVRIQIEPAVHFDPRTCQLAPGLAPDPVELSGEPARAGGAEPPAHLLAAEAEARRTEDWPEGEDFRLACRQAVLYWRSTSPEERAHIRRRTPAGSQALDRACAILERLEGKRPVPPADLKYRPAPACPDCGTRDGQHGDLCPEQG